ncbi:unnamed protein product [Prorocentrum cordatum]|uniref:Glucokinase n=1 Tax=Prorocentrum cordatum TaxID=2364126 RepID=A0ABN9TRT6_9DINO|nr:unnamed protein product [Polarella glacialis]
MELAVAAGFLIPRDVVGSTLAGYTGAPSTQRRGLEGPALELVREAAARLGVPVIAEGRLSSPSHVFSAMRARGRWSHDRGRHQRPREDHANAAQGRARRHPVVQRVLAIGAFDIGGTWLRYGLFSADWRLLRKERLPLPKTAAERRTWMLEQVSVDGVSCVGVSTGGVVHPLTGVVTSAKEEVIPDHVGFDFKELFAPLPVVALNDGLATAWAHACLVRGAPSCHLGARYRGWLWLRQRAHAASHGHRRGPPQSERPAGAGCVSRSGVVRGGPGSG